MTQALSLDLRRRVTAAISQGKSRRAAAEQFAISAASAVRIQKRLDETGSLEPGRRGRPRGGGKLGPFEAIIITQVEAHPDITMPDLAAWLFETEGVRVDPSNLSKLLCKAGFSFKKTLLAAERERPDVRAERRDWHNHRQPAIQAAPGRLLFIDETSVKTNMRRSTDAAARASVSMPTHRSASGTPRHSSRPCAVTGWSRPGSSGAPSTA